MPKPGGLGRRTLVWGSALALTLAVIALDSRQRLEGIRAITSHRLSALAEPAADAASPSGWSAGQHRIILPAIDSYHWILQAERMLAGGGWRIREAAYDDAPRGREVHWSGFLRWWGAGLAAVYGGLHRELSLPQALERVTPWANTALLALLVLVLTPILAARLGAVSAALFALGTVGVFPFYEYFVVGYFDHHGVATMAALLAVICVAGGGAGWVRQDGPTGKSAPTGEAPPRWLPTDATARRWFVASAVSAALSLWISAATAAPVLAGIGVGALVGSLSLGGSARAGGAWRADPTLWWLWGAVGGAASVGFYLLEYFPAHLGLRLEVNHPLYALAWAVGGDLLCRLGSPPETRGSRLWLGADILGIALLPAVALGARERAFALADPFLYTLHQRFIIEFLTLGSQLEPMSARVIAGRVSALPLLALPLAALLWPASAARARGARWAWHALLAVTVGVVLVFTHIVLLALLDGRTALALVGDALVLAALLLPWADHGGGALAPPVQAALAVALAPAALLTALSLAQVRWVGIAASIWLGVLVVAASALRPEAALGSLPRRFVAGGVLALVFVVAPASFLPLPLDAADPPQEVARDASWWLRRRVGGDSAVVFTSPNATTWMAYFGGFPGVGTLYWENRDGLDAAAAIYTAPTPDSLRALLRRRGVTHVVLYPWDRGLELLRVAHAESGGPSSNAALPALVEALRGPELLALPPWLTPLPYPPPDVAVLGHPTTMILELTPEQPRELALVRLAQYYQALGAPAQTEAALRASLQVRPSAPAWALLAQLEAARGSPDAAGALAGLRAALAAGGPLDPVDRVNAAIALALARDGAGAQRELDAALRELDERALRRLPIDQLAIVVRLARQLGLDRSHGATLALAESLLPAGELAR
jgi:hypothetical protein